MITDRYRWLWLASLGYLLWLWVATIYLWPDIISYRHLLDRRQALRHRAQVVVPVAAGTHPTAHWIRLSDDVIKQRFLHDLDGWLLRYDMVLTALQGEGLVFHLSLTGNYFQCLNLLQALNQRSYGVILTHVSFQVAAQALLRLSLELKLLPIQISPSHLQHASLQFQSHSHFFCTQTPMGVHLAWPLKQMSINQMQMVGYVAQGSTQEALIALPNATIIHVSHGNVLGKEGGVVMLVAPDRVMVTLPQAPHTTWTLRLRS